MPALLDPAAALDQLLAAVPASVSPPGVSVPTAAAVGRVLAADCRAGQPSPPFSKAMMDGFALRRADHARLDAAASLPVAGEQAAAPGEARTLPPGQAVRIMTGAPVPGEADQIIPVERVRVSRDAGGRELVALPPQPLAAGANILPVGSIAAVGDVVVPAGTRLAPHHLAALFEFGHVTVEVRRPLSVAIVTTGDELVPCDQTPGPGQIRNSNGPMLEAQIVAAGATPVPLGIARDDRDALAASIATALASDVVVLSGGVSAGDYDFVPAQLAAAGVERLFHKIALKPGKPLWAGVRTAPGGDASGGDASGGDAPGGDAPTPPQFVFGLPGNPVSSFVCFDRFVRPVLAALAGQPVDRTRLAAPLAAPFEQRGDRLTDWPAVLTDGQLHPVAWKGSADLIGLAAANALMEVPPGTRTWAAGESLAYRPLRGE